MKVFEFDPFETLLRVYLKMGGKKPLIVWDNVNTCEDNPKYGETIFCDDGDIQIRIDFNLKVLDAIEILAHELSHALVGFEHGHDDVFEKTFDHIFDEYERIITETST